MGFLDLRSDTVTRPTPAMREAMLSAPVGDDVLGEDPTVNELESYAAEFCGTEAALFVPSGTMANQIAIRAWCRNGDEVLIPSDSHVFFYEAGSAAGINGVQLHTVPGSGVDFQAEDYKDRIRMEDDPHFPLTRLFWVENSHNRSGGAIVPFETMISLHNLGRDRNIPVHVDGARLLNASVATGIPLKRWSSSCDSFSLCLSKGLGAPIGSLLMGSRIFIEKCRKARKAFGGGMRQAGIIASAGLYALKNNVNRLSIDHQRAALLSQRLRAISGLVVPDKVQTNILMIDLDASVPFDAAELADRLHVEGVKVFAVRKRRLRAVFHLDLPENAVDWAERAFVKILTCG